MSLKTFIRSRQFLIHLVLIIATVAVLVYITMQLLKVYTHHGESLAVPDFKGLSETEVQILAKENQLRYTVNDSVFVPDALPGTVIAQHPASGYPVKENRTIYLTIAAIQPEKVMLPQVVDVSLREAQSRLENAGLRLGQVEFRPSEFLNLVLDKRLNGLKLPDDTILIKGTAVDLIVGRGLSNEKTMVPDLMGMTLQEAKAELYKVSLNTGALVYDQSVETAEDSALVQVWKQEPATGHDHYVELGKSIDLWLTVDREKIDSNLPVEEVPF